MPLVLRHIASTTQTAFTKTTHPHIMYVPPAQVRKGKDKVIPPEQISDRQLADLAARFPAEYGDEAKRRGVRPLRVKSQEQYVENPDQFVDGEGDDDGDVPSEEEIEALEAMDDDAGDSGDQGGAPVIPASLFSQLTAENAVKAIADTTDPDTLLGWMEAEEQREGGARPSVMKAFAAKG